jgi:uncharacterized protein YndB with AHSA1/START domain
MPTSTRQAGEQAISDDAVEAKTGKRWKQWFAVLDRWNAPEKGHKETAKYLATKHRISPWWSQTVTVRYEQERGLREIGQRSVGDFQVSVQRTIRTSRKKAYEACTDPRILSKWFTRAAKAQLRVGGAYSNTDGDQGTFLRLEPSKRVSFTWDNPKHCPGTTVEITFAARDGGRTAIRVQHTKIRTKPEREEMKEGWSWAMDSLKSYLETGKPIRHEDWVRARKKTR